MVACGCCCEPCLNGYCCEPCLNGYCCRGTREVLSPLTATGTTGFTVPAEPRGATCGTADHAFAIFDCLRIFCQKCGVLIRV